MPGSGAPTGTVTFADAGSQLGSAVLVNGKASLSVTGLGTGSHNITAAYGGDTNFNASAALGSNGVTQNVGKNNASTNISASPNPSNFGQIVTVSASVATPAGASAPPTGTVTFADGLTSLGVSTITGGVASISLNALAPGSHNLVATYSGDNNFSGSASGVLVLVVNKLPSVTALTSSMNPTTNASSVVLNAVVTSNGRTPSGSVTLFDGTQQLATSQLNASGRTSFPIANLSSGTHNFSAAYSGDTVSSASLSTFNEIVVDSHASVTLASSANPQVAGAPVILAATVAPALGGQVSSGIVTFTDGQQIIASVTVANSVASLNTKNLSIGQHSIVATFQAGSVPGPFDGISSALVEVINAPPVNTQDFTLSLQANGATLNAGQTFATQISLVPVNGLTGTVRTICLGAPRGATCTINPKQSTFDGSRPLSARLVITTTGPRRAGDGGRTHGSENTPQRKGKTGTGPAPFLLGGLPASLLGLVVLPRGKRKAGTLVAFAMMALCLTGCGSDMSAEENQKTPAGSYTLVVQSQSGSITHSRSFQLTVR